LSTPPASPPHPVTSSSAANDAPASSLRGGRLRRRFCSEALELLDARHGLVEWRTFVLVVRAIGHSFQRNDREDEAAWEVGCLSLSTVAFRALSGIGANPHLPSCAGGSALITGLGVRSVPQALFSYGSDHHFDHHLGLSTEIRQSVKSLFLRKIGRLRTSVDTLPMSGGQGLASSSLAGPSNRSTPSDI